MGDIILVALVLVAVWLFARRSARRPLPESEAREILGVAPGADAETIRAAHRRLIAALHPDRGGSARLTRQINDARDVLLRR
jgi:DnaJ-domain-containing protein 1